MEIMTTWNTDFEFDLQRFADPTYSTSLFNAASGTAANNSKLVWTGTAYAWKDSEYVLQDGETQVGTAVVEDTTLKSITLVAGVTAVTADASTDYSLKNADAAVTYTNGSNTVKVDGATTSTITVTSGSLKVGIGETDKNATITGTATLGLPGNYAGTVTADVAYAFTAHTGTPEVTFNSTTGLTATTAEITVQATNGKVYTSDLSGGATVGTSGVTALETGASLATTSTSAITVPAAATVTINGWQVAETGNDGIAVIPSSSKTGGITKITKGAGNNAGTATVTATLGKDTELTVGGAEYVLAAGETPAVFALAATTGNSSVTSGDFYIKAGVANSVVNGNSPVAVTATAGDAYVTMTGGALDSVTGLGNNESISVTVDNTTSYTLTANSSGVVTYVKTVTGGDPDPAITTKYFQLADNQTLTTAIWGTAATLDTATVIKNSSSVTVLNAATANDAIEVAKYDTTTYFLADGTAFTKEPSEYAAKLEVSGSGDSATRKVTITKDVTVPVTISGVAATVKDTSTKDNTTYQVKNKDGLAKINGAEFTVSAEGVISDSSSTITMQSSTGAGTTNTLYLSGSVSVDTHNITGAAGTKVLTYVAGNGLTDTKVTYSSTASPIVINESTNDTDTVVTVDGAITGLDAGGSVKNAVSGKDITTAGSDSSSNTYTINGVEWTVTGDEKTTFAINDTKSTQLSAISNLDLDATVTTTKKFEQDTLSVNGTTFTNVVSKDGLTFTSTKKDTAASVELNAAGESVTIGTNKYTVTSTSDGVTIDSTGKISGLTNGDIVTVHNTGATSDDQQVMTLTVSDGKLTVNGVYTDTTSPLSSTTYTLDSGETEFTATVGGYTTTTSTSVVVKNGTAGEALAAGTFQLATGAGATLEDITSVSNGVYVDKNGAIMNDNASNKAVGQIQMTDDKITYAEIGDKTQTVNVTDTKHEWDITTNGGKDVINYLGAGSQAATINSGAGDDSITASSNNDLYITLGAGKDTVNVGGAGDHTIVAGEGNSLINVTATGDVRVDATGAGNKKINHTGTGVATLYGGDGNDTIKAAGLDDSVVGGAGNNVFDVSSSSMKVSDYDVSKDVVFVAGTSASTLASSQFTSDGNATLSAGAGTATLDVSAGTGADGYYAINAKGTDNKTQFYAWAKESGSTIDLNTLEKSVVIVGNDNDDKGDTLVGGQKNDVIYAGAGDSVYGGAGKDSIILDGTVGGEVVFTGTAAGKDTVTGFKAGFEDNDSIAFVDGNAADLKFSLKSGAATVKDGDGSLTITGLSTVSSGAVELYAANTKFAVTEEGKTIKTDNAKYADVYVGKDSMVDFSGVDGALNVNLANGIGGDTTIARFSGVTSVKGGSDATTLMGAAAAESLVAGSGKTSLWGGAGADTLVGGTDADVFFMGANEGTNTMVNFTGGTDETSDTLYLLSGITGAKLGTSGVEFTTDNSKAVLTGTKADTAIHFNANGTEGVAKVGSTSANNNFGYDKTVTYYGGGSKTDKITLASGDADNHEVWLDGSKGVVYNSIDVVDAANGTGNLVIAGDSSKNTIVGGKGDNMLWGGAGAAADSLKGGAAKNNFYYGLAEGNDTISSSSADDNVNLYNISLSDITGGEITSSGVWLSFSDGSKLTVATSKDIKFTMSDGSSYTAEHSSKSWK